MTIPGIRSGLVTSAKAREPVDPAEVWEHDDLEHQRERAYVTVHPPRRVQLQPQDANHRDDPGDPEWTSPLR